VLGWLRGGYFKNFKIMDAEDMREMREEQKKRRADRLPIRQHEIESLVGVTVRKLTDYQYRINEVIDVYPIHRRWHELKGGKRGVYPVEGLQQFINKKFNGRIN